MPWWIWLFPAIGGLLAYVAVDLFLLPKIKKIDLKITMKGGE